MCGSSGCFFFLVGGGLDPKKHVLEVCRAMILLVNMVFFFGIFVAVSYSMFSPAKMGSRIGSRESSPHLSPDLPGSWGSGRRILDRRPAGEQSILH